MRQELGAERGANAQLQIKNCKCQNVMKLGMIFGYRIFIKILPLWDIAVSNHFSSLQLIRVTLLFINQTEIVASHKMSWCCVPLTGVAFDQQD